MGLTSLLVLGMGIAPQLIAARVLQARQSVSCDFEIAANSGDTCASFAASWGQTEAAFAALNPGTTCPGPLVAGQNYCVIGTVSTAAPSTSSTAAKTTTTTAKTTSTTTKAATSTVTSTKASTTSAASSTVPSPLTPSTVANCNKFHQVVSGDTCGVIESSNGVSAADFATWNPYIDANCDNLWLGYYVCIGVPGSVSQPSTTKTSAVTTTSATATGPTPQMPSIVSNCNKYYQIQSGDGCWSIEQAQGITAAQFSAWNPYVDSACDNLWLGYYVCVGVSGTATTTKATTTTTAAASGPTPQMPDTVSNCKKFHQVVSGDGCWAIEQAAGITAAQFSSWNPYVDSACDNLWLGYYVCIGV